jgi:cellulose biosynthesis protein BcsQ
MGGVAMRASVVCFASAKGGAGKTVSAASLAALLAAIGKRSLLIDADAATNGLTLLYLDALVRAKEEMMRTGLQIRGLFEADDDALSVPFTFAPNLSFIPAAYVMRQTEWIVQPDEFGSRLRKTILEFGDMYDYIIIDAQAGSDLYALAAIENSDRVVLVSEFDPVSSEGVDRLQRLFAHTLTYERTWILYNKVLPDFAAALEELSVVARYLSPIPWDVDVVRAFSRRRLALDVEHGNAYTLAIAEMCTSLFGKQIEGAIRTWRQSREGFLKAPARERLEQLETELEQVERAIASSSIRLRQFERRSAFLRFITSQVAMLAVAVGAVSLFLGNISSTTRFGLLGSSGALIALAATFAGYGALSRGRTVDEETLAAGARTLERQWEDLRSELLKLRTFVDADIRTLYGPPRSGSRSSFGPGAD